jgi:hypothetical protein
VVEQIVTLRNSLSTESRPRLTMKFLGLTICSTTLSAMCYLFYYTECSFLLVSFFFLWFWCPEFQLLLSLNVLNYGFHSFPVVDWFCLFIYLWVLTFPLEDCSEFGNFVITLINYRWCVINKITYIFCIC